MLYFAFVKLNETGVCKLRVPNCSKNHSNLDKRSLLRIEKGKNILE
jgi:hypothetical protein